MKPRNICICVFAAFLLCSLVLRGDTMWDTVYRDPDVTIELRRDYVTVGADGVPQVQFRWTFSAPRALKLTPGVSYKSRVDTTAIEVAGRRYRTISVTLYDTAGAQIHFDGVVPSHGWDDITPDSLMDLVFPRAKQLIESKQPK
jgi:hypothetical protein